MNLFTERSLQHLFDSADIEKVDLKALEKVTEAYPYFAAGQTLLAKKLQSQNNPAFLAQVQKTALYFYNPFWLHYQLLHQVPAGEMPGTGQPMPIEHETINEGALDEPLADHPPATEDDSKRIILTDGDDNISPEELVHGPSTLLPDVEQSSVNEDVNNAGNEVAEPIEAQAVISEEEKVEVVDEDNKLLQDNEPLKAEEVNDLNVLENGDVPITTDFSLEEIMQADELAHITLADVDENPEIALFALPNESVPDDVPITTEYTLDEIKQADELAHETLTDTDEVEQSVFVLPEPTRPTNDTDDRVEKPLPIKPIEELSSDESTRQLVAEEQTVSVYSSIDQTAKPFVNTDDAVLAMPADEEVDPRLVEDDANDTENAYRYNPIVGTFSADEQQQEKVEDTPDEAFADITLPHASAEDFSNEEMLRNIKSALDAPLPHSNATEGNALIPIDPYHTVDYFASQGIKMVQDNNPKDKLGKQLKSFTQWLRHMKRVGPEDAADKNNPGEGEATISKIANTSNLQGEVLTEAMADVLVKQGKADQAIQLYNKLSLLHPDKSAFFAAKIQQLKGS